jgi:ribonuclease PH
MTKRQDGRLTTQARPLKVTRAFTKYAPGSVLIEYGDTKVLCTAMIENSVPRFLKDQGRGWLTAEYSMLPGSSAERIRRDINKGSLSGRSSEIQRLIGRSLRMALDFDKLGERTIYIDADVIQADGGTRTASVTGGMIALADAVQYLLDRNEISENPIKEWVAAISVGVENGMPITDLCYLEDSNADLDMNVIMTESGKIIELQGTAEKEPFEKAVLDELLEMAKNSIQQIISHVKKD